MRIDEPSPSEESRRWSALSAAVWAGLALSATAVALIPAVMPSDYSWVSQTTSEAGAQGLRGAWLSRLSFLLFGLSVLLLAGISRRRWGAVDTACHAGFGALMTAAAAFSHRPWQQADTFDRTEDVLHSVSATAMGFAFAAGVLTVALSRTALRRVRILDVLAVLASVAIPIGMSAAPAIDGLLQRSMFAVAYAWYALEAVRDRRKRLAWRTPGRDSPAQGRTALTR